MLFGALEAGGTKMVCAIVDDKGNILKEQSFPTKLPEETIPELVEYFKNEKADALGIACFGPIDLNRESKTYGYITSTPKEGWGNVDIVGEFSRELNIPVGFDTDVNGSALGEHTYGAGKGLNNIVYITIGTGIGIGVISEGKLLHGAMHPEGGHIMLTKCRGDNYEGRCPYHKNCFEGLCSGPAIEERWGRKGTELTDNKEVWELEADYIAKALVSYTMILSPQRIILGGGVMHQEQLFPIIRKKFKEYINGYIKNEYVDDLDRYIVCQSLDDRQGILGAAKLGQMEYDRKYR